MIGIVIIFAILTQLGINFWSYKINYFYSSKWLIGTIVCNIALWISYYNIYGKSITEPTFWIIALVSSFLLAIIVIDFKYYEIPNEFNFSIFGLGILFMAYKVYVTTISPWAFILGSVAGFTLYFVLLILSRGSVGGGDVKMAAALGMVLSIYNFATFVTATFVTAAIVSIILLILKIKTKKDKIAFGPYIALAAILLFLGVI